MKDWQLDIIDKVAQGKKIPRLKKLIHGGAHQFALQVESLADALAQTSAPVTPSAALRERLMASIEAAEDNTRKIVPVDHRRWHRLLPGIQVCTLSRENSHRSVLLKIAAGYALPRHSHRRIEQAMVLEGSCWSGDILLKTGDFFLAHAGTKHENVKAIEDCLILVISHR